MISTNGRETLKRFVNTVKTLLMDNITAVLQRDYGIWAEGRVDSDAKLTTNDPEIKYRAKLLRQRIKYIKSNLPEDAEDINEQAVRQLTAEQAFTVLNRFCALRMCEERGLILPSVANGYDSDGFRVYDSVTGEGSVAPTFMRYSWYLQSIFDELAVELPAVFDRFSPYGLLQPDEITLKRLFDILNDSSLTEYYDEQSGIVVNFWKEDETLGWIFQYYNSLEERRRMRDESGRPRNSREMAVRNQFFTPDYVVRFLTDNSLGRMWYEMTGGKTDIVDVCKYLRQSEGEIVPYRELKDPIHISMLDPACGSMHFGLYTYDVMEAIYLDAWDNQPALWQQTFRYQYATRDEFKRQIPKLILENNIHGVEIDPRALQIAALSLWLRAQQSWSSQGVERAERPTITKSHLVLAEAMPGNKRMLSLLTEDMEKPMQRLIRKVWDAMRFVGEAGLLIKMEKEISEEIEALRKNWEKLNREREQELNNLFSTDNERQQWDEERILLKGEKRDEFFEDVKERLQKALHNLSSHLSQSEGYENALFANDAVRGFAFIELCQKKYDVILMNPPFGEGSENTSKYLDDNYPAWAKNLVCAFFDRTQELLTDEGVVGGIFDRTVLIKSSYEDFRKRNICGHIKLCADTGWNVLDANVETSTLILSKSVFNGNGVFIDVWGVEPSLKADYLLQNVKGNNGAVYLANSNDFINLPNTIVGYKFDEELLAYFRNPNIEKRGLPAQRGMALVADIHFRLFYEMGYNDSIYRNIYEGSPYTLFYTTYRDTLVWEKGGEIAKTYPNFRPTGIDYVQTSGVCYGKRGEILDAHIKRKDLYFTVEGQSIPNLSTEESFAMLGHVNSIVSQYAINLYTGQHKPSGYMNLLPMPDFMNRQDDITRIVTSIIDIKRWWFNLDETNLEYRGLISQLKIDGTISESFQRLQVKLSNDYNRYQQLVNENDELWIELANIKKTGKFYQTLIDYKSHRPAEDLLSIDSSSTNNIINQKNLASEIIQELVGMVFGRWDVKYAHGSSIPDFDGLFDALPFMPKVALDKSATKNQDITIPFDGIIVGNRAMASKVSEVIKSIWKDKADDIEYELRQLIGTDSLQAYFEASNGFFDYHFKRYTKSRRKAPIYWPITSSNGGITIWVYYPKLSENTLPAILLKLRDERNATNAELINLRGSGDRKRIDELETYIGEIELLEKELTRVNALPYVPNHDDGVPVTAAPLCNVFRHTAWKNECIANMKALEKGEYDWSHLAYTLYPDRIRNKVKKDWCLALTHGLEELCEKKPKPKAKRGKKSAAVTQQIMFDDFE